MPIEIRELVIRATVDPGEAAVGGCSPSSSKADAKSTGRQSSDGDENMVQTCVREVLRVLDDKRER